MDCWARPTVVEEAHYSKLGKMTHHSSYLRSNECRHDLCYAGHHNFRERYGFRSLQGIGVRCWCWIAARE